MSSSLLERARGFHEDLEIYERAVIEQLENKPRTQKVREKERRSCLFRAVVLAFAAGFVSHDVPNVPVLADVVGCLIFGSGISKGCAELLLDDHVCRLSVMASMCLLCWVAVDRRRSVTSQASDGHR